MFLDEYSFEKQIPSIMTGVYGWMSCALAITAGTAYYVAMTPTIFMYITQPGIAIGLLFAQLFFVFGLIFFINRMSFVTALLFFLLYSCSLGVTLASLFYIYTKASIISTFLTTAITFGCMSLYGYFTKADLTSIGNLGFMALIGLIVGMIINMFLASTHFDYILSEIGVIVFVMLTAYN